MILIQSMELDGPALMPVISPTARGLADHVTTALVRCQISYTILFKNDCYFINIPSTSYLTLWLGFMGFREYFTIVCPELLNFLSLLEWSNLTIIFWLLTVKSSMIYVIQVKSRIVHIHLGFVHSKFHHYLAIGFLFALPYQVTSFYVFRNQFSPWGSVYSIFLTLSTHISPRPQA